MRYVLAVLVSLFALPAYAQVYDIPGAQTAIVIRSTPEQPGPNSTVLLTVASPLLDLSQSYIAWRVNGAPLIEGEGVVSASVQTGNAGDILDVSVSVVSGEDTALAEMFIVPASVDILWEADGYTPPFYGGRTLPGVGASVTLVAYPTFIANGVRLSEKDLVFTWRRGETVLGSQSGKGKSSISLRDPLMGDETVTVDVRNGDGSMVARSSVRLPEPRTLVHLYIVHPLFGLLLHQAIGASTFTGETEATFQAVPFFAPAARIDDGSLTFDWRVNQRSIAPDPRKPSEITINAEGSDGIALIGLDVGHRTNFFFGAQAAWQITFASSNLGPGVNPFAPQQ